MLAAAQLSDAARPVAATAAGTAGVDRRPATDRSDLQDLRADRSHASPPAVAHPPHRASTAGGSPVTEEVAGATPFATLLRFRKADAQPQPKVLIVAPMSGHFATLLRDTVRTMLPDHDVYVTDWHNARDVPLAAGRFGLDEYTDASDRFLAAIGPGGNMVAICQPCVAALAAVALMSEDDAPGDAGQPDADGRPDRLPHQPDRASTSSPTTKQIAWFEQHLISRAVAPPRRRPPRLPRLRPARGLHQHEPPAPSQTRSRTTTNCSRCRTPARDATKAETTRTFYEEYLAVADLPAEFYLETVALVFQSMRCRAASCSFRGRLVDPAAIRRTALLTIEGERDDICAIGQTLAAQDLCSGLRPYMRTHYVQPGVGHYGVFSGRRWQRQIYPVVRNVIQSRSDRSLGGMRCLVSA